VTEEADRDGCRAVRRLVRRLGPGRVIVTGCSAQRAPELYTNIQGVRLVAGNSHKEKLLKAVHETESEWRDGVPTRLQPPDGQPPVARVRSLFTGGRSSLARAYLRVQDGCNQQCTFCTLPSVRGKSASVPLDLVLEEARKLETAGHQELVFSGAHLGSYGYDLEPRIPLDQLIREVLDAVPSCRVRLSSLEPRFVGKGLLDLLANQERLCPHLHLPLQSGDDGVLAAMKRAYRRGPYEKRARDACESITRRAAENGLPLALGSDFIVGFPGEDDRAFAATMDLVERLPFTYGHVFPYSNRPETPAAVLPSQIERQEIRRRGAVLRALLASKARDFRRRHLGQTVEIIVERIRPSRTGASEIRGMSERFLMVRVRAPQAAVKQGSRLLVSVTHEDEEGLSGESVGESARSAQPE